MQKKSFIKKTMKKFIVAGSVFVLLSAVLIGFVILQIENNNQKKIISITQSYATFADYIQSFLINNANMMRGFSAYIQTFQEYNDEDVYEYLDNLVSEDNEYIRNIGIIKDTTIVWNYPMEGNSKSIGTDLGKVPGQAETLANIKRTMKYNFDGPINLVQGGTGYIFRVPIVKNDTYWGMISIVLKADKVRELFDAYANECGIKVAIISKSNSNTLVYGDRETVRQASSTFHSAFNGAEWKIYVVKDGDKANSNIGLVILVAVMGLFSIIIITYITYKVFRTAEEAESRNSLLNEAVMKDGLTELFNRKYFDGRIVEEIDLVNRYEGNLAMIFFDLDHFKRVNDTYGHSYGDEVLKRVAIVVKQNLRSSDVFARWGGEEFAILLPETTLQGAEIVAEKLRRVLEELEHPIVGKVTASFGVAQYFKEEFIGSWFKRVDDALYTSKANGRNLVTKSDKSSDDYNVTYRIHWNDEWISGNKTIDEDHKELLRLGNELIECSYRNENITKRLELANYFIKHITAHFKSEEEILINYNYSEIKGHLEAHKRLEDEAVKMLDKMSENIIMPQELVNFMQKEVIISHLVKEDTKFFYIFHQ